MERRESGKDKVRKENKRSKRRKRAKFLLRCLYVRIDWIYV